MRSAHLAIAAFVVALLPALALGQGLGDTAARERERRAKRTPEKTTPSRTFTNEDLDAGRPPGQAVTAGEAVAPPPAPEAPSEGGGAPLEDPQAALRPYIEGLRQAQSRVEAVEARIRELSAKLNPMSTTFIYGATGSNNANEEAEVRQQLQETEAELREARGALAAANEALEDARRGRAPLGPNPE